ncbi:MAG: hypothetical protein AB8G05_04160 [Oligoflexales bacterium]
METLIDEKLIYYMGFDTMKIALSFRNYDFTKESFRKLRKKLGGVKHSPTTFRKDIGLIGKTYKAFFSLNKHGTGYLLHIGVDACFNGNHEYLKFLQTMGTDVDLEKVSPSNSKSNFLTNSERERAVQQPGCEPITFFLNILPQILMEELNKLYSSLHSYLNTAIKKATGSGSLPTKLTVFGTYTFKKIECCCDFKVPNGKDPSVDPRFLQNISSFTKKLEPLDWIDGEPYEASEQNYEIFSRSLEGVLNQHGIGVVGYLKSEEIYRIEFVVQDTSSITIDKENGRKGSDQFKAISQTTTSTDIKNPSAIKSFSTSDDISDIFMKMYTFSQPFFSCVFHNRQPKLTATQIKEQLTQILRDTSNDKGKPVFQKTALIPDLVEHLIDNHLVVRLSKFGPNRRMYRDRISWLASNNLVFDKVPYGQGIYVLKSNLLKEMNNECAKQSANNPVGENPT